MKEEKRVSNGPPWWNDGMDFFHTARSTVQYTVRCPHTGNLRVYCTVYCICIQYCIIVYDMFFLTPGGWEGRIWPSRTQVIYYKKYIFFNELGFWFSRDFSIHILYLFLYLSFFYQSIKTKFLKKVPGTVSISVHQKIWYRYDILYYLWTIIYLYNFCVFSITKGNK